MPTGSNESRFRKAIPLLFRMLRLADMNTIRKAERKREKATEIAQAIGKRKEEAAHRKRSEGVSANEREETAEWSRIPRYDQLRLISTTKHRTYADKTWRKSKPARRKRQSVRQ